MSADGDRGQCYTATMQLFGTPRSHYTRVVRVLSLELSLDIEFRDTGNPGEAQPFGGNPLMKVPVLHDGDVVVWESDHICRYLVERAGSDPLGVARSDWAWRNAVAVAQGVMASEVTLVLAARSGLATEGAFFDKARATLRRGLAWFDERAADLQALDYRTVYMVAMWDHLILYNSVKISDTPQLAELAAALNAQHKSLADTRPALRS
ncbi:MAG TPA: glutathione S-transferase family protein [Polyangiaceae bacterium]|nr:glutathione S-transferase family protein [Polyangiaceae bacterium]